MNDNGLEIFENNLRIECREIVNISQRDYSDAEKSDRLDEIFDRIFDDMDAAQYKVMLSRLNIRSETVTLIETLEGLSTDLVRQMHNPTAVRQAAEAAQQFLQWR